jgi:AcrR family transcriptional regulator
MATIEHRATERPGGRSARVQAAVRQAVTDLVCQPGGEPLTIPVVATRAGVNPTSIYRRWGDIQELLAEVAESNLTSEEVVPDTGTLRGDLHEWVAQVLDYLSRPGGIAFLRTVVNISVDEGRRQRCLRSRRMQLELMLRRAADRGEPVPALDTVMDHVLAPLYFRVLFGIADTHLAYARDLADDLLSHLTTS